MKFPPCFLLLLVFTTIAAFGAAPATNAPTAAAPAPTTTNAPPAAPVPPPAPPATLKLDDYINDLATTLKLTDGEKHDIEAFYVSDGNLVKNILNNDKLSPFQKAAQVSEQRDVRNGRIETLLQDDGRKHAFLKIEAQYRVALTELAADGGWVAAPAPVAK
jgi:hypothetical protein